MRPPCFPPPLTGLAALALLAVVGSALACANPTVQYHRQFEYLVRVGGEALEEGRSAEARKHLLEASQLAPFAAATDLEQISTLTQLTRACRELGELEDAVTHANLAAQILARHRLGHGGASSGVYRVGAAYLLERGRLEVARGDLTTAQQALEDFVKVRGDDGGDEHESALAQLLLGELRLARGIDEEAHDSFRASLDAARDFGDRDPALRGFALYRMAEHHLAAGRSKRAAALIDESRGEGAASPELAPGLLLMWALIDADGGDVERASLRLDEALGLMEAPDAGRDARSAREPATPARAIGLAARIFDTRDEGDDLQQAVMRALAVAEQGTPLRAVLAGRASLVAGRRSFEAGAVDRGISMMVAGRLAISAGIGSRVHDAAVEADYEIAAALEQRGKLAAAARPCARLVAATPRLSVPARDLHAERLLACGRIATARGDAPSAREALGRALMVVEEAGGAPVVQLELLLRLAALAHDEGRDAEEGKLFDRVLPFVVPGVYEDLERLLAAAYAPYGRYQPSSAAARLGHAAARSYAYAIEAPQLQSLAEKLGAETAPASRR